MRRALLVGIAGAALVAPEFGAKRQLKVRDFDLSIKASDGRR
jgi:hypothetical protein